MGHKHHHGSDNILFAFILNFSFAIIELIGGYITNSVTIYSDALHDFGDSLALLFSYFAEKIGNKDPDKEYTFGYKRFSILSAFINGIILILGSLFVLTEAVQRLAAPEEVMPEGMLALAVLGIIVNSLAAFRLSKEKGMNARMVTIHLLEDLLGWIAVLIVSIILLFKPWYVLDSILSILIALIILRTVYKNMLKVGMIFLQKFPDDLEIENLKSEILKIKYINNIHALKGWSIDESSYYLRFHVILPEETQMRMVDQIKSEIKEILKTYNVAYSTIEFETEKACDYE